MHIVACSRLLASTHDRLLGLALRWLLIIIMTVNFLFATGARIEYGVVAAALRDAVASVALILQNLMS